MKELDSGHQYILNHLDGNGYSILRFVKREGNNYPGNSGTYEGTTIQEVIRACIARLRYVNSQIHSEYTTDAMFHLREAIYSLELRAAGRHNRSVNFNRDDVLTGPFCNKCGHVKCNGECHA